MCSGRSTRSRHRSRDQATLRQTPLGPVVGFVDARGGHRWLGLPFAAPPVGELRWKAPRPPQPWTDVREALAIGNMCVQYPSLLSGAGRDPKSKAPVGNEDCLYLNIFAPPFAPGRRADRRPRASGDVLDPRRRQQHRARRQLQRLAPRDPTWRGRRHDQLSTRAVRLVRAPGATQRYRFGGRQLRQLRSARLDRGAALGARQHRCVRRQSEQRHDLRRVSRRRRRARAAGIAIGEGPVPSRDRRKRRNVHPRRELSQRTITTTPRTRATSSAAARSSINCWSKTGKAPDAAAAKSVQDAMSNDALRALLINANATDIMALYDGGRFGMINAPWNVFRRRGAAERHRRRGAILGSDEIQLGAGHPRYEPRRTGAVHGARSTPGRKPAVDLSRI